MHERTNIRLSAADRRTLEAVVANRNSPQKHVWRANIILLTGKGHGTAEIMRTTGKAKTVIWRWQERFREEGAAGLWRDKTRPSRIRPLAPEVAKRVIALTLAGPPPAASHWTGTAMSKAAGISVSSVQRIWRTHGLQPHRVRQFKLSNDPQFATKLKEIVGLYVNPPDHAIVLSIDEKSQIQALDRTQPGLPMKKGRAGTVTHDYKRHGVTTLFAALDVLDGKVIGQCMKRHRHQEFIRFLNVIDAKGGQEKDGPRYCRQLCYPQASRRHGMDRKTPTLRVPLHPDLSLLAQCHRGSVCHPHKKEAQTRRVPIPPGTQRRHSLLPQRHQCQSKTLYLGQGPQQNHRCRQTRAPSVRFDPLGRIPLSEGSRRSKKRFEARVCL
jgi:transposase